VHLACDGAGRPLALLLSGGQAADGTHLAPLLEAIRVPRVGRGRPRSRPDRVLADKGYSYPVYRRYLRRRGIACTMPERADHRRHRAHRPGRPPAFDADAYKRRNVVERCINRLKQCRALATRYDKTAAAYHAFVTLAALRLWLPQ
jgi:transposase